MHPVVLFWMSVLPPKSTRNATIIAHLVAGEELPVKFRVPFGKYIAPSRFAPLLPLTLLLLPASRCSIESAASWRSPRSSAPSDRARNCRSLKVRRDRSGEDQRDTRPGDCRVALDADPSVIEIIGAGSECGGAIARIEVVVAARLNHAADGARTDVGLAGHPAGSPWKTCLHTDPAKRRETAAGCSRHGSRMAVRLRPRPQDWQSGRRNCRWFRLRPLTEVELKIDSATEVGMGVTADRHRAGRAVVESDDAKVALIGHSRRRRRCDRRRGRHEE